MPYAKGSGKTNWPEAAIKTVSPCEKGLEWPVTQQGHVEQKHYLKSHLENKALPRGPAIKGGKKSHKINKRPNGDAAPLTITVFGFATLSLTLQSFHIHDESPVINKVVFYTAQRLNLALRRKKGRNVGIKLPASRSVNNPTSSGY